MKKKISDADIIAISKVAINATCAAKELGISLSTYIRRCQKLGCYENHQHKLTIIHKPSIENGKFSKNVYMQLDDDGKLYTKYLRKKNNCKKEDLICFLTFDDFCQLLIDAGIKSSDLGFTGNYYVLARYNDTGNYELGNCRFITHKENMAEQKNLKDKIRNAQNKLICPLCGKTKHRQSTICLECSINNQQKNSKKPQKEVLLNLIKTTPFTTIGKMYEVSDNTVRKWCQSYNLPFKHKDIVNLKL